MSPISIKDRAFYLVAYDISDDRRRSRVVNILEDYGSRVQYSVFEVLTDDDGLDRMLSRLRDVIKFSEDSIRVYYLCCSCKDKTEILGRGEITSIPEVYIV